MYSTLNNTVKFDGDREAQLPGLSLVRSESMEMTNDPRFFGATVLKNRMAAFKTISVVATLLLKQSASQMFKLSKKDITPIQYVGFVCMTFVFLICLFTVIVIVQQLFHSMRLLTVGASGFEMAKGYYMNINIASMRHTVTRGFFCGLPLFVAATMCMVLTSFGERNRAYAIPVCIVMMCASICFAGVVHLQRRIFRKSYDNARAHEGPLTDHMRDVSNMRVVSDTNRQFVDF